MDHDQQRAIRIFFGSVFLGCALSLLSYGVGVSLNDVVAIGFLTTAGIFSLSTA